MWTSPRRSPLACAVLLGGALLMCAGRAGAEDAGVADAATDGANAAGDPSPSDPRAIAIRALLEGTLDVAVPPATLFDVSLDEEATVRVEAARLRALLRAADDSAPGEASTPRARARPPASASRDGGTETLAVDPALLRRRVELDRARLEFYALPPDRRASLLRDHAARVEAARPRESDEERRAREAEEERRRVLAKAKAARTEAERLLGEELARLIAVESRVLGARERFREARAQISERRDAVLGWQRRARDAASAGPAEADLVYDALRRALRTSRDDLSAALDALAAAGSELPAPGADTLLDLPSDIPTRHVRERRVSVERAIAEARLDEASLRKERASSLLDEITVLNRERLSLLGHLSSAKRDAVTGFTAAGWDQARSEARHLTLLLRHHQQATRAWLGTMRAGAAAGVSPWRAAALALPLLVVIAAFAWARRRTHPLLEAVERRLAAADRAERRLSPSLPRRAVGVLQKTHRPLEWFALYLLVLWLLPEAFRNLHEVELLTSAAGWILAGALVVNLTHAIASGSAAGLPAREAEAVGPLRLRSLRLVGRTVVVFALILVLSAGLVGEGTIHDWVFSTCWFAALPVFLVLVRWWRGTVFARIERARRKGAIAAWVLANRAGWKSFCAAMIGALYLFGTGSVRTVRGWLSGFDLARRVHAYLFRRDIERIGERHAHVAFQALSEGALLALHPERTLTRWVDCPSNEVADRLRRRIAERRGGLVAVIGARGMGKSSLLRALCGAHPEVRSWTCSPHTTVAALGEACGLGTPPGAEDAEPPLRAVLLDDAHALTRPSIGGLALYDQIVAFARAHAEHVTWVFALDASVWPLLRRARDARPVFDETHVMPPWNEVQIAELLAERCASAAIVPTYDDLLDPLPPGADEFDRQDALREKQAGYVRMLWDHVGGNPALALETFRASLAHDEHGIVHVRSLQTPDATPLERLPDSSLFVLRAVLQLAPASPEEVALATRLRPEEVLQDIRFGRTQGYFVVEEGQVLVAWPWLRAVTRLLTRRHLLVTP